MRRMPRHIAIACAAASVGYFTLPGMLGTAIGSSFEGISIPGAMISACLWSGFGLVLRRPKIQQWMILGMVSPFLSAPLFFVSVATFAGEIRSIGDLVIPLKVGIGSAVVLLWLVVPIGIGMGGLAAAIASALRPLEAEQDSGLNRLHGSK